MKNCFTLAEILITLGIIGVVAVLTLPALMVHYKQTEIETGLKKAYSTISNAIEFSKLDNGPMEGWSEKDMIAEEFWEIYLNPYFKGATLCNKLKECHGYKNVNYLTWHDNGQWNIVTDNSRLTFQLPDGNFLIIILENKTNRPVGRFVLLFI